ncbi:MAG: L,D-transpeptidase family protein [Sphingomonas sp.]|nr:L,D-transpeptidase family protein [Sphingomonas sp.]
MSNKYWIGAALSLALCSTALSSCSVKDEGSGQGNATATSGVSVDWNGKTEKQLREAIANAPAHGLKPDLFLKGGENGAALTEAALKYASALANGYSDPSQLHEVYTIPHPKTDVRQGLADAIQKGDVKSWLESLAPQTDEYRALSQAHLHYLQLAQKGQFQPVALGKPIKPGSSDPRLAQVVAAMQALGYLNAPQQPGAGPPTTYSGNLIAAVKKLQGDYGFKQDGIIGGNTLDALNAGPGYRARELAVAMERLRWLPRNPPGTRIDVNTAASTLDYWRDGSHVDHRKVVEGEADKPTPQLQAPIVRLVANPTWRVPEGIGVKELSTKSPAWLAENGYVQKEGKWVQQSGPKNSLGLVKFDMDDKEAIYLHDTPAKALFGTDDRHRSHGCVRVQNAIQFATALAEQEGVLDQFQQAMQGTDETFIKLPKPIPVRLLYQTVSWDGSAVQFRQDVYGWDDNVAKALGLEPGPPQRIEQPESSDDIGP